MVFRQCLREVINERLHLYHGSPPHDAQVYKDACLKLFFGHTSTNLLQQVLIHALPNGDWRDHTQVQYYMDVDDTRSPAQVSQLLEVGLCCALVSHKPSLYPRHRWTGSDRAIDELMKLQCIHGLLGHAYVKFMKQHTGNDVHTSTEHTAGITDQSRGTTGQEAHNAPRLAEGLLHGSQEAEKEDVFDENISEEKRGSEFHSKDRKVALQWLESNPFGRMVVLRAALQPIMSFMYDQFRTSSQAFELEQRSSLAQALLQGSAGHDVLSRQYMLTIAATGQLEQTLVQRCMEGLKDTQVWSLVPDDDLTASMNNQAMVMMCRPAALIEELLGSVHRKYPFKLFTLLTDRDAIAHIQSSSRCLLDPWSKALIDKYPDLSNIELKEILYLHCQSCSNNIAEIEAKHASNRRVVHQRSVQTHAIQVPTLSAEWLGQNQRRTMLSPLTMTSAKVKTRSKELKASDQGQTPPFESISLCVQTN